MGLEASFVRIYNGAPDKDGQFAGTAFFIGAQQLITAKHILKQCDQGAYLHNLPNSSTVQLKDRHIEYSPCERDVALIHTDIAYNVPCIALAENPPQRGDKVWLFGFRDAIQAVRQIEANISNHVGQHHSWNISEGVNKGMSGGAVIRASELTALIYGRDKTEHLDSYCIPIDEIRRCFPDSLPQQSSYDKPHQEDQDELKRAEKAFIGRHDELQQLKTALLHSPHRPVAITALHGMAGVGKSWLVDHFYITHQHQFPGGYHRIVLDAEQPVEAKRLLAELAERLDISVEPSQQARFVQDHLQQKPALLHIENVDADSAAREAKNLCKQLPNCTIVLSGRLENFGRSAQWQQISLKPFTLENGIAQLKVELAWLKQVSIDALDEAELDTDQARALVRDLGGLPLAIHLAAGYLAAGLSIDEFLSELHHDLDLPPEDAFDGILSKEAGRATLKSTFNISLRLLAQQGQQRKIEQADTLFACLGHAPLSGFGLSIAAALVDQQATDCQRLLRLAQKLSLLEPMAQARRWQIHPLLAEHLRQLAADTDSQGRLHQWFLQRLPMPDSEQDTAGYQQWRELNQEQMALSEWLNNIPAELQSTVERAGSKYAMRHGPFTAWQVFCQNALNNSQHDEQQRSNILFTLMEVAQRGGDIQTAEQAAKTKYKLDTTRGETREAALAKGQIADILTQRGNLDEALRIRTQEQLPVYESLGDVRSIAITKGQIADILTQRGNLDEALRICTQEQLPVYESLGDVRSIAITKGQIADILWFQGKHMQAIQAHEDALPILEQLRDQRNILIAQVNLGQMYIANGENPERGIELLISALKSAQAMQIPEAQQIAEILRQVGAEIPET